MERLADRRAAVDARLADVVDAVEPAELSTALGHVVLSGGKRVRPVLTLLVHEALTGGPPGEPDDLALDFAAGIELVHSASLVVDDVIDRSELRRGEQSAWRAFGHGPAIVASDALLGEAFRLFLADPRATEVVADAMVELGEGEATELVDPPTEESEYLALARRKTGALFRAAAQLGAVAADADAETIEAVGGYAERVGVAFQLRDDVLDAVAGTEELGKPAGKDAELGRPSVLQVTDRDPEGVTALAEERSREARRILADLDLPGSEAGEQLDRLARFVVERER